MTTTSHAISRPRAVRPEALPAATIGFLAVAAAMATSAGYLLQPELIGVARDLHSTVSVLTAATGSSVIGYLVGLAALVPLVDHFRPHRLIAVQLAALTVGLSMSAIASDAATLAAGQLIAGAGANGG